MKWTAVLNPAQTPANVSDQPVHALTKEIQFLDLEMFSRYFPIFGQLHIDQYLLVIHGQLIDGWGLVQILTEHKFSMIGLSAIVDKNNVMRARYTSLITLCALEAAPVSETDFSSYDWLTQKSRDNTLFLHRRCVIDLQIKILMYVHSIREGNFKLSTC